MSAPLILWDEAAATSLWTRLKGWREAAKAGVPFEVSIKSYKDARSLQALKYYWGVVLTQISEQARFEGQKCSKDAIHEYAKRQFIGCIDLPGGGAMGLSTSTLNGAEFAIFVTQVQAWAAMEHGVQFPEEAA